MTPNCVYTERYTNKELLMCFLLKEKVADIFLVNFRQDRWDY